MPTVLRKDGMRVVIYVDDHEPPHVHVFGDRETKVVLGDGPNDVEVIKFAATKRTEAKRAERLVAANHAYLCEMWSELHG
jgi:Domain of unknown function (DUF4160)